jgi:enoyl-CoA hydratase/carnithine racemase
MKTIVVEREGPVLTVTLDRPKVLNAYSMEMRDDLFAAFTLARDDGSIRAVVLRGNGSAFCSGGDLAEFGAAPSPVVAREVRWKRDVWGLLRGLPQPTIAAVHGHAAGSGMEMALLCDFRIAATDAVFSLPETALGLIPGVVGTQTAPRAAGLGRALELVLAGRRIDAFEAFRIGLVGSVVRPNRLREEADRLARRASEIDKSIAAGVTELVRRGLERPLEAGLARERIVAAALRRSSS